MDPWNLSSTYGRRAALAFLYVVVLLFGTGARVEATPFPDPADDMESVLGVREEDLVEKLGIHVEAVQRWDDHAAKVCRSGAAELPKCTWRKLSLAQLKELADTGEPVFENQYAYALEHLFPEGGGPDDPHKYFLAAADHGLPHAQVTMGWMLLHGVGMKRDPVAAFEWNMRGALQGHPEGANNVAFQYEHGLGVKRDMMSALSWYAYAALRGSPIAYGTLLQIRGQ
jgi:TPR repeat protein